MLAYGGICWHVVAYASICWHMPALNSNWLWLEPRIRTPGEIPGASSPDPKWLWLLAIAARQSHLGSRELSPGIAPGILIRGFSQSQLESRAGICQHMLAYLSRCQHMLAFASICQHMPAHAGICQHVTPTGSG